MALQVQVAPWVNKTGPEICRGEILEVCNVCFSRSPLLDALLVFVFSQVYFVVRTPAVMKYLVSRDLGVCPFVCLCRSRHGQLCICTYM